MTASPTTPPRADDGNERLGGGCPGPSAADLDPYERFVRALVDAQLRLWLPEEPSRILDISRTDHGPGTSDVAEYIAAAGHQVIRVLDAEHVPSQVSPPSPNVVPVIGDLRYLDWFRSDGFDAVVAEGGALSACLATETAVEQAARLLKPGGRMLLTVDSLLNGLARLAEQHRWPELADASAGDVVVVSTDGNDYARCFGPSELRDLMSDAGFEVEWVRPRTVIPPEVVRHTLGEQIPALGTRARIAADAELDQLVASELDLAVERQGEALGLYLTVSARLRGA